MTASPPSAVTTRLPRTPAVDSRLLTAADSASAPAATPSATAPAGVGATPRRVTLYVPPPLGTTSTALSVWLPRSRPMFERLPNNPMPRRPPRRLREPLFDLLAYLSCFRMRTTVWRPRRDN